MLSVTIGPIAGPSRLRCFSRGLQYTARSLAPPKRRTRTTPTLPSSPIPTTRSPIAQQTQSPLASQPSGPSKTSGEATRTPPLAAAWKWRTITNPSRPDLIEEERTIFARPFEMGRPRMYWFGFVVSGLFFTTWLTFPPSARSLAPTDGQTEYRESPMDVFIHYAGVTAVASVTVAAVAFMALPSRYITRLSLIRSRPVTTSGAGVEEAKVFWRLRHAGHEMFSETSKRSQPRDVAIDDLNVKMLYSGGNRSPYLSVTVTEPRRSKYLSLDALAYRMDYRDTELTKTTDAEVVLSLNRIEHIFGRLDPEGKPVKAVLVKGE